MAVDYDLLRSFVEVAKSPSFVEAAKRRRVTQSAISQQMKSLENQLGIVLFEKVGRRAQLTRSGRDLYESIAIRFSQIDLAVDVATHADEKLEGQVRIGAPGPFAKFWLRARIAKVLERFPQIELELVTGESYDLEPLLQAGKLDVAVYFSLRKWRTRQFDCVPIAEEELVAVVAPTYLQRVGPPTSIQELRTRHVHMVNPISVFEPWWRAIFGTSCPPPKRVRFSSSDMEETMFFALQGFGVAILPTYLCGGALETGQLVPLPLQGISPELEPRYRKPIYLAWRTESDRIASIHAVRTTLLEDREPELP